MIRTSLIDFLNTGCLGPLRPGASMEEVISLLGEPQGKIGDSPPYSPHVPYWLYGNLELQFALPHDATPYVEFLQIDMPERLRKKARRVAKNLMLDLYGLNRYSRPSQFIREIDDIDRVEVCLVDFALYPYVTIYIDDLFEINFSHWGMDQIETPPRLRGHIRRMDIETRVTDLYSWDHRCRSIKRAREETWPGRFAPFTVSGREYLKAIAQ